MIEILNPRWGDVRPVFEREFQGMVVEPVTSEELRIVGKQLVSRLHEEMTQDQKRFIVSVKEGKPLWDLLGVPGIENLPAVRWKVQNIRRMTHRSLGVGGYDFGRPLACPWGSIWHNFSVKS